MQNCEEHCPYTHICRDTYPDNDGGCWCHEDGYCVDGRKKEKNKNGMRVNRNLHFIHKSDILSKAFDY